MATVTRGSVAVNAAVNATRSSTGTLYAGPPSNGYALLTLFVAPSSNLTVTVGGTSVCQTTGTFSLYVGPSQAVAIAWTSGGASVCGVEFVNT